MEVNNFDRKSQRAVEATKRLFEENEKPSDLFLSNLAMHSKTTEGNISIAKRSEEATNRWSTQELESFKLRMSLSLELNVLQMSKSFDNPSIVGQREAVFGFADRLNLLISFQNRRLFLFERAELTMRLTMWSFLCLTFLTEYLYLFFASFFNLERTPVDGEPASCQTLFQKTAACLCLRTNLFHPGVTFLFPHV